VFTVYLGAGDVAAYGDRLNAGNCAADGAPRAMKDMCQVAQITGGRLFGSDPASLATVFKDIRGYQ
jgi:hypothetical protein